MIHKGFAVFILSWNRASSMITYNTLKKSGYTGKTYIIVSSDDPQIETYKKKYKKELIVFNRDDVKCDPMDNSPEKRGVVYARNACFDIARRLGLTYFAEFDDDYDRFEYRFVKLGKKRPKLGTSRVKNLDKIFDAMLDYLDASGAKTVAMAQGGDFIGGVYGRSSMEILRKAMNGFFCRADRPFEFFGRMNEDAVTYALSGSRGDLFLTETSVMLHQKETQSRGGGMTELYKDNGTYVKSFYSVMANPSSVTIKDMGNTDRRIHHSIDGRYTYPKILNERLCKWRKH